MSAFGEKRGMFAAGLGVALLVLAGCGGPTGTSSESPGSSSTTGLESSAETSAAVGAIAVSENDLAEWISGTWTVDFELLSVVPVADLPIEWAERAADQPTASWKCDVDDQVMTIDTGVYVYSGTFSVVQGSDNEWLYDGVALWMDDEGSTWTSHIVVEGYRDGMDAFTADQYGEISSDSDGMLYTAEWLATASRIP